MKNELELRVLKLQQLVALSQFLIALNAPQVNLHDGTHERILAGATEELNALALALWP